jgi:hypothetical protein
MKLIAPQDCKSPFGGELKAEFERLWAAVRANQIQPTAGQKIRRTTSGTILETTQAIGDAEQTTNITNQTGAKLGMVVAHGPTVNDSGGSPVIGLNHLIVTSYRDELGLLDYSDINFNHGHVCVVREAVATSRPLYYEGASTGKDHSVLTLIDNYYLVSAPPIWFPARDTTGLYVNTLSNLIESVGYDSTATPYETGNPKLNYNYFPKPDNFDRQWQTPDGRIYGTSELITFLPMPLVVPFSHGGNPEFISTRNVALDLNTAGRVWT